MRATEPPIIVICGPTASGKSALGVTLAREYNGEIISADSRQIYTHLTIGTAKISRKDMRGVRHHGISICNPKKQMSVTEFRNYAEQKIEDIRKRGRIPFIVGGTGLYISSLIDRASLPDVPPNPTLRKRLAKKSADELFHMLKGLDPARALRIDAKNPRRLIRAIEIVTETGSGTPPAALAPRSNVLMLGIGHDPVLLRERIDTALALRLKRGVLREMRTLVRARKINWRTLEDRGIDYRFLAPVARGEKSLEEVLPPLRKALWDYAKRQLTWFKKDKRIHWIKDAHEAQQLTTVFLKNPITP